SQERPAVGPFLPCRDADRPRPESFSEFHPLQACWLPVSADPGRRLAFCFRVVSNSPSRKSQILGSSKRLGFAFYPHWGRQPSPNVTAIFVFGGPAEL